MVCIIISVSVSGQGALSHLGGLASHFTSTSKGAVDLSSQQGDGQLDGEVLQGGQVDLVLQRGAGAEEVELLAVHTLQHGELGTELGNIGLGGDLHHVGLTAVHDQLHSTNLLLLKYQHTSGLCQGSGPASLFTQIFY